MTADSAKVLPPIPRYTVLPPPSLGAALRGRAFRVRFRVTEAGQPDSARTIIEGRLNEPERQQLLVELLKWAFWPALLEGCAVPGSTVLSLRF